MDALLPVPTARELLQLEPLGDDRFRAAHNLDNLVGIAFGGQFLGQALAAAQRTAPDWPANSLNGYFLGAGKVNEPLDFTVTRCHDGRRFAIRRVSVRQGSRNVFELTCSFHQTEPAGLTHQFEDAGTPPDPETLLPLKAFGAAYAERLPPQSVAIMGRDFPIELRLADPEAFFRPASLREFWFRMPSAAGIGNAADHQALLAIMSDYWLPASIAASHTGKRNVRGLVSVNHSLWFHAPADTGSWLFYRSTSPWADHGRGLAHGRIFDRTGRLVATAMQEALLSGV
jgi:acyl-CoA thioesterase-2